MDKSKTEQESQATAAAAAAAVSAAANTAAETARRNKRRKPPNYYQSAEYAAILKSTDDANASRTAEPTNNTLLHQLSTTVNSIELNDSNSQKQEVKCEPAAVETLPKLVEELPQAASISSDPFDDVEVAVPVDEVIVKPVVEQTENKAAETVAASKPAAVLSWSNLFKAKASSSEVPAAVVSSLKQTSQKSNGKLPLSASVSMPNQPSVSSALNGLNTDGSSLTNLAGEADSSDVLRLLGAMFQQCELKHSAPALQPRGIKNKQNWCYVNAVWHWLIENSFYFGVIFRRVFLFVDSAGLVGMSAVLQLDQVYFYEDKELQHKHQKCTLHCRVVSNKFFTIIDHNLVFNFLIIKLKTGADL